MFSGRKYLVFAVLRVLIALHLLKSLAFELPIWQLLYGSQSFADIGTEPIMYFLHPDWLREHSFGLWAVSVLVAALMLFGVGSRITIAAMWLLLKIKQGLNGYILDGGDNLLVFVLLYLIAVDSFRHLSVHKARIQTPWLDKIAMYCIIGHLSLAYFVSGMAKANAEVWANGTAIYYILQNQRFQGSDLCVVLANYHILTVPATYFTMIWEALFPALIFIPRLKWVMIGTAVCLHLSIYYLMMLHEFQLFFMFIHIIFLRDAHLYRIKAWGMSQIKKIRLAKRLTWAKANEG